MREIEEAVGETGGEPEEMRERKRSKNGIREMKQEASEQQRRTDIGARGKGESFEAIEAQ